MNTNAQQQAQPNQEQQDIELNLTLKVSQINTIIAGLDELPHKFSRPIIDSISQQAQPQIQAIQGQAQPIPDLPDGPLTEKTII